MPSQPRPTIIAPFRRKFRSWKRSITSKFRRPQEVRLPQEVRKVSRSDIDEAEMRELKSAAFEVVGLSTHALDQESEHLQGPTSGDESLQPRAAWTRLKWHFRKRSSMDRDMMLRTSLRPANFKKTPRIRETEPFNWRHIFADRHAVLFEDEFDLFNCNQSFHSVCLPETAEEGEVQRKPANSPIIEPRDLEERWIMENRFVTYRKQELEVYNRYQQMKNANMIANMEAQKRAMKAKNKGGASFSRTEVMHRWLADVADALSVDDA